MRHFQQPQEHLMVCPQCRAGSCTSCVDALLAKAGRHAFGCKCRAGAHDEAYRAAVETFLRGGTA